MRLSRLGIRPYSSGGDSRLVSRLGAGSDVSRSWEARIAPAARWVEEEISGALEEVSGIRDDVPSWKSAFQAVMRIASSDKKHLFRPKLVVLGYARGIGAQGWDFLGPAGHGANIPIRSGVIDGLVKFAAGVELQHLFMFVHDDMMDHAQTRRGEDTVNVAVSRSEREFGHKIAPEVVQHLTTLVGDVLQAKAAELLAAGERAVTFSGSSVKSKSAMTAIMKASYRAGAAQFEDVLGWKGVERIIQENKDEADATVVLERLLADKSSNHSFAAPLVAGHRLGVQNAEIFPSEEEQEFIESFATDWALHTGAAFQGLDDVMDMVLEVQDSGKDRLQDIQEGRLSLPLFLLRQFATQSEWEQVGEILGSRSVMAPSERHLLLDLVAKYKLTSESLDFVDREIELSKKEMKELEEKGDPNNIILLEGIQIFEDNLLQISRSLRDLI